MKTRIRTLRIGAAEFKWTAELCPPRCARVRVWGGGKNGCMLRADLASVEDAGLWGDDPDAAYPTPGVVRAVVQYALDHGWDPAAVGGRHVIGTDAELEIPGFRVTDLLQSFQHLKS
jgi:hypothetical protein